MSYETVMIWRIVFAGGMALPLGFIFIDWMYHYISPGILAGWSFVFLCATIGQVHFTRFRQIGTLDIVNGAKVQTDKGNGKIIRERFGWDVSRRRFGRLGFVVELETSAQPDSPPTEISLQEKNVWLTTRYVLSQVICPWKWNWLVMWGNY